MTRQQAGYRSRTAASKILLWALLIGSVSFAAGFFGPILFSTSNLGPLLGIFGTGPTGALLGALWGAWLWGSRAAVSEVTRVWKWVVGIWVVSLIYTLFLITPPPWAIFGAAVQVGVLGVNAALLYHAGNALPVPARRCGRVILIGVTLALLMTLFPPVTRPWWGSTPTPASVSLPRVAFIMHRGFDSSQHVPLYAVNRPLLLREWAATLILGALTCYFVVSRARRDGFQGGQPGR